MLRGKLALALEDKEEQQPKGPHVLLWVRIDSRTPPCAAALPFLEPPYHHTPCKACTASERLQSSSIYNAACSAECLGNVCSQTESRHKSPKSLSGFKRAQNKAVKARSWCTQVQYSQLQSNVTLLTLNVTVCAAPQQPHYTAR